MIRNMKWWLFAVFLVLMSACGDSGGENGGKVFNFVVVMEPAEPFVGKNKWSIEIKTKSGAPVTGAEVGLRLQMPVHGHGSVESTEVRELGGGKYEVFPVTFQMPGRWVVTITVRSQGQDDVWIVPVEVP